MNAVFRKEFRSMLREKRGWLVPVVYVALLGSVGSIFLVAFGESQRDTSELGQVMAGVVAIVQMLALHVFAPLVGAAAIAGERERGTFTVLLASPVDRMSLGVGKAAAVLYCGVLLCATLPVAAIAFVFGGPDWQSLAGLYLTHAVVAVTLVSFGLAVSTVFQRTWTASFVAIGVAMGLAVVTLAIATLSASLKEWDDGVPWVLFFNPGFSLALFFDGDGSWAQPSMWWLHYAALLSMAAVAFAYTLFRLRRQRG